VIVAITGLVQFPYPQPIYFFYFAALVALAIFALVEIVWKKGGGRPIYAGPDCGQVQFLSGLPDAVSSGGAGSPGDPMLRPDEIFRRLKEKGARALVLNREPLFSRQVRPEILSRFEELFPHSRAIGRFVAR
jgi:hypothetical protein